MALKAKRDLTSRGRVVILKAVLGEAQYVPGVEWVIGLALETLHLYGLITDKDNDNMVKLLRKFDQKASTL